MRQLHWYRRDGKPYRDPAPVPTDSDDWLGMIQEVERDLMNPALKRVAETTLPDGTWISTVWLGINHNFGIGPPLIFETMVFTGKGPPIGQDIECRRYSSEAEALAGHDALVAKYRAGL